MDYLSYGLNNSEYKKIVSLLGKNPSNIELALFSAMWSEHCSYKSSKVHLKKFFSKSKRVISSFGENAGVIDIGGGEKVAFKIESHNHPSKIEPFHGAATGVGGILRDVFAMNARPIALGNYLCFGEIDHPLTQPLLKGVVKGIGGYGNCIGIPTITGHTEFHTSYNENILVNAFALGIYGPKDKVMTNQNSQTGALLVYVGAQTGRDGIHGASMASESFSDEKENRQSTVQVGDPFFGKLLMESCLEVMRLNLVLSAQDMGAAGLVSSSFEMASKVGLGMNMDLSKIPLRDSTMSPEDILLSESQERMLLVCEPSQFNKIKEIFNQVGLPCVVIGEVVEECQIQLYFGDKLLASIDPKILTDKAPEYDRPYKVWSHPNKTDSKDKTKTSISNLKSYLIKMLAESFYSSRNFIYDQYDQRVGAQTVKDCSCPIGVIQFPYSHRFIGVCLGGRSQISKVDASVGAMDAICYPAIQLSVYGFEPLAVTDGLNFGNPEKIEVMSEFVACVENMSKACEALLTPVISGNVSFYNEFENQNIIPTPATGVVGLKENAKNLTCLHSYFKKKEEIIYLLPLHQVFLSSSLFSGKLNVKEISKWLIKLRQISDEKINSVRVVGKGGLLYTISKMTIPKQIGASIHTHLDPFQERLYEVIITTDRLNKNVFEEKLHKIGLDYIEIGSTGENHLIYNDTSWDLLDLKESHSNPIAR